MNKEYRKCQIATKLKIIRNKLGLIKLAKTQGKVSQACNVMEYSRHNFNRGYPGARGIFHLGTSKGVRRIYRQTFIRTCTRIAFVKLYARKNAPVATDFLNERVVPWYDEHAVRLRRIL